MKKYLVAIFETSEEDIARLKEELTNNYSQVVELYLIDKNNDVDFKIEKVLKDLQITSIYKGYKYIIDAVRFINEENIDQMCSLYIRIAAVNHTSYYGVERAIRSVVSLIQKRNKKHDIEQKLGIKFSKLKNSLFVFALADLVKK